MPVEGNVVSPDGIGLRAQTRYLACFAQIRRTSESRLHQLDPSYPDYAVFPGLLDRILLFPPNPNLVINWTLMTDQFNP